MSVGGNSQKIGGFIGENWANIVNCYSSSEVVTGGGTTNSGGLAGGLGNNGKVFNCYFLAIEDEGGPNNGIGVKLTDAQMKQRASFSGWDFLGIIGDGVNNFWKMSEEGYPNLSLFNGYIPAVPAGEGTVDNPYLIETVEQFGFITRNPNVCYRLINDIDFMGIVSTSAVIPVFYGQFDGNGHIIQNLTLANSSYTGLFGTISKQATVFDLGVLEADITGQENSEYLGVMSSFNKGTIATCAVTGTVTGGKHVGGLVGENIGNIIDCYATCNVTGVSYTGGLVGENDGTITTSYVNGQVSNSNDDWGIGYLVGYNDRGIVVNCLWEKRSGVVICDDLSQGLTTSQMMDMEAYSLNSWADNPNWIIDSGNDFPRLVWEGTPGESISAQTIDWFSGDGTPEDPYQIETVEQLRLIGTANIWNAPQNMYHLM